MPDTPAKLAPPEPLTAPEPVTAVAPDAAEQMVDVAPGRLPGLDGAVAAYVDALVAADPQGADFTRRADDIRTLGDRDVAEAASTSNRLLAKSMREVGDDAASQKVPATLVALRRQIEDLDPVQAQGVKKLFGMLPYGDRLRDYFRKYESSQAQLDAILVALRDGQDELRRDNADLESEKRHLWEVLGRLREYTYMAAQLDEALTARIDALRAGDPQRAKALETEALFYIRQKRQDLLTQQAVAVQGYLAIDLLRRNNLELIRGVDRAANTTLAALRTAVIVAQALASQRLVLDQVTALDAATSSMIASTGSLLRTQTADIAQKASSATIDMSALSSAFADVYAAMDAVDTYKVEALSSMRTTIDGLSAELDKSRTYIDRAQAGAPATTLALPE